MAGLCVVSGWNSSSPVGVCWFVTVTEWVGGLTCTNPTRLVNYTCNRHGTRPCPAPQGDNMRMWMVNPGTMCRRHLLGEHVECHMLASVIKSGKSLQGFINNGLIDTSQLEDRHEKLASEMTRRGYNHQSPLYYTDTLNAGVVDAEVSRAELARRCPDCKTRQSLEARYA